MQVHERIAAAVADKRLGNKVAPGIRTGLSEFEDAACDHADKVLARHTVEHRCSDSYLYPYAAPRIDPEVRALADLWLGAGWEDQ